MPEPKDLAGIIIKLTETIRKATHDLTTIIGELAEMHNKQVDEINRLKNQVKPDHN